MSESKNSAEVDSQSSTDTESVPSTQLQVVHGDVSDAMQRFEIATDRICHIDDDVDAVYAGRNGNRNGMDVVDIRERGWLGNPFTDGSNKQLTREFEEYLDERLQEDPQLAGALSGLAGKRLACFCQHEHDDDTWCHTVVLAAYADFLDRVRRTDVSLVVAGTRSYGSPGS
jgi:hypothetical protein